MFRQTQRIEGAHNDGIWTIDWKDGNILTGSLDGSCKLWNATEKSEVKLVASASKQSFGITSVICANDGSFAVSVSQDAKIRLHDMKDMAEIGLIDPGILEAWTLSISPRDDIIASGTHQGSINIWSVHSREKTSVIQSSSKFVLSTAFSSDNTKIASVGMDGILNIYDLTKEGQLSKSIEAHSLPARKVIFSEDGNLVFTASDDRHVSVFDTKSGTVINSFSHSGMALTLDLSPDRRHILVGCSDHIVAYWDLAMQRREQSFDTSHSNFVWGVSFDATGNRFASVGEDALLQIYETSGSL